MIQMYDARHTSKPLHSIQSHSGPVYSVRPNGPSFPFPLSFYPD